MRKIAFAILSTVFIAFTSCKESKKNTENQDSENTSLSNEKFTLIQDSTKVSFTAYKTTEKVPVGGQFKEIKLSNVMGGDTPLQALDGIQFKIPVSSLFTNDPTGTRDPKILEFFFGVMKNTELISGVVKVVNGTSSMDVTLNGETQNIPLEHEIFGDDKILFNGVMNLENWNAMDAVSSINKACEILHTGNDGISKTWSEVAVKAEVHLQKK